MAPNLDADGNEIDHPNAQGRILANGKFLCGINNCGAEMKNARHNISSHISKKHRINSAFLQADAINRRCCGICGFNATKFHLLVHHVRTRHGFRGRSKVLQDQYATTQVDDDIQIPIGQCTA
ncbi:hypothetical protein F4813DRAFT_391692 [Daldinia decipiens]|uniref:uncharacterized protein n=1 Tax=Daldinia decipiens TaxID=326647 RepID=UPI0020C2AD4A|nr:uncharacterized protein F4813DRAFT_391692 [Daldinia decipiens]KAI1655557.1 hypothetical protein F4813DRAFT_391692 [Daldinia decipiens]